MCFHYFLYIAVVIKEKLLSYNSFAPYISFFPPVLSKYLLVWLPKGTEQSRHFKNIKPLLFFLPVIPATMSGFFLTHGPKNTFIAFEVLQSLLFLQEHIFRSLYITLFRPGHIESCKAKWFYPLTVEVPERVRFWHEKVNLLASHSSAW